MTYEEWKPAPLLENFIRSYWWFDNTTSNRLDYTILPDGSFDLLIHYKSQTLTHISLTGLWTKQVDISIDPDIQIFAIRFKPLAAEYIFQTSITDILDSERPVANTFWQIDQIDWEDKKATAQHLDNILLNSQKPADPKKLHLFELLFRTNGEDTIQQYATQTYWTSRQINRYFNDRFGLSLKQYCNILKVFASYRHIKEGQLYPELNFFDQSHFIKAVQKHTGHRPEELHKNKNDRFLQLTNLPKN